MLMLLRGTCKVGGFEKGWLWSLVPGVWRRTDTKTSRRARGGGVDDDNSCVFLTGEYDDTVVWREKKEHDNGAVLKAKVFFDIAILRFMRPNSSACQQAVPGTPPNACVCVCVAAHHQSSETWPMEETNSIHAPSPGFLALQLTILTLSACTDWLPLSILNVTFLIKKVHTSSQNRYVSRLPWRKEGAGGDRPPWRQHIHTS